MQHQDENLQESLTRLSRELARQNRQIGELTETTERMRRHIAQTHDVVERNHGETMIAMKEQVSASASNVLAKISINTMRISILLAISYATIGAGVFLASLPALNLASLPVLNDNPYFKSLLAGNKTDINWPKIGSIGAFVIGGVSGLFAVFIILSNLSKLCCPGRESRNNLHIKY